MRALIDDTRPNVVSPITTCPCRRAHVTPATFIRCWASTVWHGWRRHLIGDWNGTHALIVEHHHPRRQVTIGLFTTITDRDVAAWFASHEPEVHMYVTTVERPPP